MKQFIPANNYNYKQELRLAKAKKVKDSYHNNSTDKKEKIRKVMKSYHDRKNLKTRSIFAEERLQRFRRPKVHKSLKT